MTTKQTQQDLFRTINNDFIDAAKQNHGYAYVAGYFSSTINEMFAMLSKKDQAYMLSSMEDAIRVQQERAKNLQELADSTATFANV